MNPIFKRLAALRQAMQQQNISATIIPGTDPHASEYIADYWKEREWISGFDGSAGTMVITLKHACLWTDSRYFIQAEAQLLGTEIQLMKQGLAETLDIPTWLKANLIFLDTVGINPQYFSYNEFQSLEKELYKNTITLTSADLIGSIWVDRPALPLSPFYIFKTEFTGRSTSDKLVDVRIGMKKAEADVLLISALDEIAWLFNIRSNDIAFNPVVIAYVLIEKDSASLFVAPEKLSAETRSYFQTLGVNLLDYRSIHECIENLPDTSSVWLDGTKLNYFLIDAIPQSCTILNNKTPLTEFKSIKNETEIAGIRKAMIKDGVALTKFFMWLEGNLASGDLTEISIAEQLEKFRNEQENFVCESFGSIAGYGPHGAIVHYSATPETNSTLKSENILLLDSGGQYLDGTTDITRTVALGKATDQQKRDFSLVLKGHIALASAIFPEGTCGSHLDILARKELWKEGLNYGHGTGHGVGHFLCVHEGPQSIRPDQNPTVLKTGMLLSNEPGMYRANEYGIRIENLIQVIPYSKTEFGEFLQFETLTLFPLDRELIEIRLLTDDEMHWVNNYHQKVFEKISPMLDETEREWLEKKCKSI